MLGVFDSGIGGLTICRAIIDRMPAADVVYLADQAHMPYGTRSGTDIVRLTRTGCEHLVDAGCNLIVLACNTASAIALRGLQRDWLPELRTRLGRAVNVLGIIVPTIEAATGRPWRQRWSEKDVPDPARGALVVFATRATVRSHVYEIEIAKRRPDVPVLSVPCPNLASLIESGTPHHVLAETIAGHVRTMRETLDSEPAQAVLGSTHYEVVADLFAQALAPQTRIIRQPHATAEALEAYLSRHPEYDAGHRGTRRFLTTGAEGQQHRLAENYWGSALHFESLKASQ